MKIILIFIALATLSFAHYLPYGVDRRDQRMRENWLKNQVNYNAYVPEPTEYDFDQRNFCYYPGQSGCFPYQSYYYMPHGWQLYHPNNGYNYGSYHQHAIPRTMHAN